MMRLAIQKDGKSRVNAMPNMTEVGRKLAHILGWKRHLKVGEFSDSTTYWQERYKVGGTSGSGSYGRLAQFKAEVLNDFLKEKNIRAAVEFGCGDGNQLRYILYPTYLGLDVSPDAIERARKISKNDSTKRFEVISEAGEPAWKSFGADLSLSLDVIYHLVEDAIFDSYMRELFLASNRFVIVYSSNLESVPETHVRHRCFTDWVVTNAPDWNLIRTIPNRFPFDPNLPDETSKADFFIFEKRSGAE